MTKNGKIIAMIAIGLSLMVFLAAIVGIMRRDSGKAGLSQSANQPVSGTKKQKTANPKTAESDVVIPAATASVSAAASAVIAETNQELKDSDSEISDSEDVFNSQEISDLSDTYAESDFQN
jgi:hypothetical protein